MMRLALLLFITALTWQNEKLSAQTPFIGEVTWAIDHELSDASAVQRAAERIQLQSDGSRTRWTEHLALGSRTVITDLSKREEYVLIEFLGEKLAIITPRDKVIASPELTGSTREHKEKQFGYQCAELLNGDNTYLYIPKLQVNHSILPAPGGLPVLFAMKLPTGTVYYRATSLEEKNVASSAFALPEEYRKITTRELQLLFSNVNSEE